MPITPSAQPRLALDGQEEDRGIATHGNPAAPVLVVCDALGDDNRGQQAWRSGLGMTDDAMRLVGQTASGQGFTQDDFLFVQLCAPMPKSAEASDSRKWAHVQPSVGPIHELIERLQPKMVVTFGSLASRAVLGRSVKITKARGQIEQKEGLPPVMPMLGPGFVLRIPEHKPTFEADWLTLSKIRANGWTNEGMNRLPTDYQWRADISDFLGANKPKFITVDTETTGLQWYRDSVFPFLVQFSPRPGLSLCLPIHERYWEKVFPHEPLEVMEDLKRQVAELLEDPEVMKAGFNLKFDRHMLTKVPVLRDGGERRGITLRGWKHDAQLMAFQVNENMMQLSLDECVRVWVPELAGYADQFNATIDKERMIDVPPEIMLPYAGGDTDATFRLLRVLQEHLKKDPRQWNVYRRVQMPALQMFAQVTEPAGVMINQERLESFGAELREFTREEYKHLIRSVPAAVRRKHMAMKKDLSFTRDDFTRDVLFSQDGFKLKPQVFTDSTKDLEDKSKRVPSVSTKDHLPYFVNDGRAGDFILRLTGFVQAKKLQSTYVGERAENTGFWKYIADDGSIHPSFSLTSTNTGRTASRDPNGQNFPKRGRWAKSYQEIFIPRPGRAFAASDLSQIELRLVAWMAMEPEMLRIYRSGGDIHETTAAVAMGVDEQVFKSWKRDDRLLLECANEIPGSGAFLQAMNPGQRATAKVKDYYKLQRFRAKAVNFGFVYGMSAKNFRTYAKTDYGIDYTEQECEDIRNRYFAKYRGLVAWHATMREIVGERGFVRASHGAVRHLPSIFSQDRGIVSATERQAINAPIQRFGSDLCLVGAMRFQAQVDPEIARVVLTVHDQVVLECKLGYEEPMIQALCWAMQNPPLERWFGVTAPLPFGSDAEISTESLGKMEEREDLPAAKPDWWNDDEDAILAKFCDGMPAYAFTQDMTPEQARAQVHVTVN